jgi:hypothetical protein
MEAREKASKVAGSGVARGCAGMLYLGIRIMKKLIRQKGQDNRSKDAALDRSVCPADTQRGLRQQGASREAPAVAQRLVRFLVLVTPVVS